MENDIFENVFSLENLHKAHLRARLSKRHKKEVIEFENSLCENLLSLYHDVRTGKYEIGGYHSFMIYDPKPREIQAITYRDRVVQHCICDNYLIPLLERKLIYDNSACRKGRGTSFAISRLKKFITKARKVYDKFYFVKIDVSKYFPSIDHSILKAKLFRLVTDEKMLALFCKIVDSYNKDTGKGIPMGNQTSQCLALYYLDAFDRYFKEKMRVKFYLRYMDDIIMIVANKMVANECIITASKLLEKENLLINPKSSSFPMREGISFLGWHFTIAPNGRILQKPLRKSVKRMINKAKTSAYYFRTNRLSWDERNAKCNSYFAHFNQGNAVRIRSKVIEYLLSHE